MTGIALILFLAVAPVRAADADIAYRSAQDAVATGDLAGALPHFEAALRFRPDDLRIGNDYRQAVVRIEQVPAHERCIAFFDSLTEANPDAPNAWLNLGYANVDKIPHEGAITQVLLANTALGFFSTALDLEETWLVRYTRGNSYLYWPAIFGRTPLAVKDLARAIEVSKQVKTASYHARAYVGLGEAYWRLDDLDKARSIWREGLKLFPKKPELQTRLDLDDESLTAMLTAHFEPGQRVDTDLSVLWEEK